ncbi:MAG: sigma-70 family RNA polymerase sigma factor [Acidiferrobacterales bacterium]
MNRPQSDEDLMVAYAKGNYHAFKILYQRHKSGLYRYLLRQCGRAEDAQELFQDIWTNLTRARERYEVRAKFATYLYRLAHNRVIDHYRRQAHNPVDQWQRSPGDEGGETIEDFAEINGEPVEDRVHRKRLVQHLLGLIDELPPPQREVFLLREEGGFSVEEIAEVTGVNAETAKSRLRYAVAKLRKGLRQELSHESE